MTIFQNHPSMITSGGGRPPLFARRELQCIELLIESASVPAIAKNLGIAENTVRFYLTNIRRKARAATQRLQRG